MLGIFYSFLPSSLRCRTFTFISGFGRKVSGFRFVGCFALGYIRLFLKLASSLCCPSEGRGFCFLGKLLLFPGQRHVLDNGFWLSHGWTLDAVGFPVFSVPVVAHMVFSVCARSHMASGF